MRGTRKGEPQRFVKGHQRRLTTDPYKVEERGYITPCWTWQRYRDPKGYGIGCWDGKRRRAHRRYYEHAAGPIPEGTEIDHLCRNRSCVNPEHLEAVLHVVNVRRGLLTKLDAEQVRQVWDLCDQGWCKRDIGRAYGIGETHVGRIARREKCATAFAAAA